MPSRCSKLWFLVLLPVLVAGFVATPSFGADFHVFGRIGGSSGLGVEEPSVGVASRFQSGPWVVDGQLLDSQKAIEGSNAMFWGGSLEYRHLRRSMIFAGRVSYMQQQTDTWSKSGSYASVRVGYRLDSGIVMLLDLNAPDSTENHIRGVGFTLESLSTPIGLIAQIERVWFDNPGAGQKQSGTRIALSVGYKF